MVGGGETGGFVEPALAGAASFEDHGGQAYGTTEDMQPLGERPSSKVKQRVKHEAPRKSALGRSWAAVNSDVHETPDSTPGPAPEPEPSQPVPMVADDDNDGDYAPKVKSIKAPKKERAQRGPKQSRQSTTPAAAPVAPTPPQARVSNTGAVKKPPKSPPKTPLNEQKKLARVTEAAKERAIQVGKPELAAAVQEIYENSLTDTHLTDLLGAILSQRATPQQTRDFQGYVKRAKQKLKDAKKSRESVGVDAKTEPLANGGSRLQSIPLRSPSHPTLPTPTPPFTAVNTAAIPSTEVTEQQALKKETDITLKSHSPKMASPLDNRADGNASDSSLTELESDGEGNQRDEIVKPTATSIPPPAATQSRKDHAAERGTLAAPKTASSKRPSAEFETMDDETERVIYRKKQKLQQGIIRDPDHQYQESSVRPTLEPPSASRLRSNKAQPVVPPPLKLSLKTNGTVHATRSSKRASSDLDSPLSDLSSKAGSPALLEGGPPVKRAKTKTSYVYPLFLPPHLTASSPMQFCNGKSVATWQWSVGPE